MTVSPRQLEQMWTQALQHSNVQPQESLVVLTGEGSRPYTDAVFTAARNLRADVYELRLPAAGEFSTESGLEHMAVTPLTGNGSALKALKSADMVVDLLHLLHSPEQLELLQSGTRILMAVEPPDVLARMMPSLDVKDAVRRAGDLYGACREMRVTSSAGTDLRLSFGEYPSTLMEYAMADEPGRWDHWPSGFLARWPDEGSAEGTVVLDRGDILLPLMRFVSSPIVLTVQGGYIRDIRGDGWDAELLNSYMSEYQDPEGFAVSHCGWGLQPRALWTSLLRYRAEGSICMDARAYAGNFLFSTGPNLDGGGKRNTACHVDIPMRNCSVSIDGRSIVAEGRLVG